MVKKKTWILGGLGGKRLKKKNRPRWGSTCTVPYPMIQLNLISEDTPIWSPVGNALYDSNYTIPYTVVSDWRGHANFVPGRKTLCTIATSSPPLYPIGGDTPNRSPVGNAYTIATTPSCVQLEKACFFFNDFQPGAIFVTPKTVRRAYLFCVRTIEPTRRSLYHHPRLAASISYTTRIPYFPEVKLQLLVT